MSLVRELVCVGICTALAYYSGSRIGVQAGTQVCRGSLFTATQALYEAQLTIQACVSALRLDTKRVDYNSPPLELWDQWH